MRNPDRIDIFVEKVRDAWKEFPDWRFGQFMLNVLGDMQARAKYDLFFMEDEDFFKLFDEVIKTYKGE